MIHLDQQKKLISVALAVGMIIFISGCKVDPISSNTTSTSGTDTQILRVEITPDPIAQSSSAVFKCIITDSLDVSMRYTWFLDAPSQTTDVSTISWTAPSLATDETTKDFSFTVQVRRGDNSTTPATQKFNVTVVQ